MSKVHGKFGKVYLAQWVGASPPTPTEVFAAHKWSLTTEADIEESTDFNSNGWKEYLAGCVGFNGDIEGWFDSATTQLFGGALVPAPIFAGQKVRMQLWVDKLALDSKTAENFLIDAYLNSVAYDCDVKGNVTFKAAFTGTGAPAGLPMA